MISLVVHAVLGFATTGFVAWRNRRLFAGSWAGRRVTPLEATFSTAAYLAVVERQVRYDRAHGPAGVRSGLGEPATAPAP